MIDIKRMREARCLTQAELASKLNVSQSTIATWETQKGEPRTGTLPKIAQILGCTIDELFTDEEEGGEVG